MVRAEEMVVDVGGFEMRDEAFGNEEVVNAPADVALAGFCPMRPPSVALEGGIEIAEGVDEAGGEEIFNSLAFFFGESGVMLVVFRAGEVERSVGDVEIAANNDGLGALEGF